MTQLIIGKDEAIAAWVRSKIPDMAGDDFGPCVAIGMASDDGKKLWGGIVYHSYSPGLGLAMFTLASIHPRWAPRETIRRLLAVPFRQYNVRKLSAAIACDNERSLKLARGLGFKMEARLRHQFGDKRHGEVWSMMRTEFEAKWGREDSWTKLHRARAA